MINKVTAHPTQDIWIAVMFPAVLNYDECFVFIKNIIIFIIALIIITNT